MTDEAAPDRNAQTPAAPAPLTAAETLEAIATVDDMESATLTIPQWRNITLLISSMTIADALWCRACLTKEPTPEQSLEFYLRITCKAARHVATKELLFDYARDGEWLKTKSAAVLESITDVALPLSGINVAARVAERKNASSQARSNATSSN